MVTNSDGKYILVGYNTNGHRFSKDYGATWNSIKVTGNIPVTGNIRWPAMSSDGKIMMICAYENFTTSDPAVSRDVMVYSNDIGNTWETLINMNTNSVPRTFNKDLIPATGNDKHIVNSGVCVFDESDRSVIVIARNKGSTLSVQPGEGFVHRIH